MTSDILFLQKRGRVLEQDAPWIHVGETENGIPLNQYFIDHPEMVCGEMQMVSGPYGMRSTCVPNEKSPLAEQLDAALSTLHAEYTLVDEQEYAEEESGTIDAFVRHCIIQGVISGVVMVIGIPLCVLTNKITNYTKVR